MRSKHSNMKELLNYSDGHRQWENARSLFQVNR